MRQFDEAVKLMLLSIAAAEATVAKGAGLLAVYSAGLGIPFLIAAFMVEQLSSLFARMRGHLVNVERAMGHGASSYDDSNPDSQKVIQVRDPTRRLKISGHYAQRILDIKEQRRARMSPLACRREALSAYARPPM